MSVPHVTRQCCLYTTLMMMMFSAASTCSCLLPDVGVHHRCMYSMAPDSCSSHICTCKTVLVIVTDSHIHNYSPYHMTCWLSPCFNCQRLLHAGVCTPFTSIDVIRCRQRPTWYRSALQLIVYTCRHISFTVQCTRHE